LRVCLQVWLVSFDSQVYSLRRCGQVAEMLAREKNVKATGSRLTIYRLLVFAKAEYDHAVKPLGE
jgi:hypothetical protein